MLPIQGILQSLQSRIMINIILVHAIMMSALVYELVGREEALLHSMAHTQAQDIATGIASSAHNALLSTDLAGLNELITVFKRQQNVNYLMIARIDGRIMAHTQTQHVGRYLDDPSSLSLREQHEIVTLIDTNHQLDIAAPIIGTSSTKPIGWVRLSLNLKQQQENQQAIIVRGIFYTLLATVFGAIVAWLLARKTALSLKSIQQASQAFTDGDTQARVPKQPFSELQLLASGMNKLLETIHQREHELRKVNSKMTFLAMHDALTQLANPRAFYDRLHQLLKTGYSTQPFSLVMIDLDGFKPVNDTLGHDTGDAILVSVADRLRTAIPLAEGNLVARLGGDEFTLILMQPNDLTADLEHLRALLAQPYYVKNQEVTEVSASIGAVYCQQGQNINEMRLLKLADNAMYEAKNNGRNRVVIIQHSEN